jgi:uncharacterized delta-60 repeat protein
MFPLQFFRKFVMKIHDFTFFFILTMISFISFPQDGSPDLSFGNSGTVHTDIDGERDLALAIAQQKDGKLIVAGGANIGGNHYPTLVRYLINGTIDTSFGTNGVVWKDYGNSFDLYKYITVQEDNKIIAGGRIGNSGNIVFTLTRYFSDGTPDSSFGINGDLVPFENNDLFGDVVFLDSGKFLTAGSILDGIYKIGIKRFLPNGALDLSYGNNGIVTTTIGNESNTVLYLKLLNNGKFIALAIIKNNGVTTYALLRYLPDGLLDVSYGINGVVTITIEPNFGVYSIAAYNNYKIAVLSYYFDEIEEQSETHISRYLPNGGLDTSFGDNGIVNPNLSYLSSREILIQANQRLLFYAEATDFFEGGGSTVLKRYYTNGSLDPSFNIDVVLNPEYFASTMILQDDGKIVCVGSTAWYNGPEDFVLERYNNNPLGVTEFENGGFSAFPNPTHENVTLTYDFIQGAEVLYRINDIAGKVLMRGSLSGDRATIDLSTFQAGLYILKMPGQAIRLIRE